MSTESPTLPACPWCEAAPTQLGHYYEVIHKQGCFLVERDNARTIITRHQVAAWSRHTASVGAEVVANKAATKVIEFLGAGWDASKEHRKLARIIFCEIANASPSDAALNELKSAYRENLCGDSECEAMRLEAAILVLRGSKTNHKYYAYVIAVGKQEAEDRKL